jgi:hypothetical protein
MGAGPFFISSPFSFAVALPFTPYTCTATMRGITKVTFHCSRLLHSAVTNNPHS